MKRLVLVLLGLLPLPIGWLLNTAMAGWTGESDGPFFAVCLAVFVLWFLLAFVTAKWVGRPREVVFWLNFPALIVLVMLGVQELVLNAYWTNAIGVATQLFYLPVVNFGYILANGVNTVFFASLFSYAMLVCVSFLGCYLRRIKTMRSRSR